MRKLSVLLSLACISLIIPRVASATDVWDLSGPDGGNFTDNELASGSEQVHDLQNTGGVADQDWYLIGQLPYSSYEVVVDGLTEEVAIIPAGTNAGNAMGVDLVDSAGSLVVSGYAFSNIGAARSLRFRNQTATEVDNQYVRVQGAANGCTTTCTTNAEYRILLRETTLMASRFNNSGTQTTILILQNGGRDTANGTVRFWNSSGTLLASSTFSILSHGGMVLNTSGIAGATGAQGSITIDHTGRFGQLTGKAVALEPSTGFTFDTLVVPKFN